MHRSKALGAIVIVLGAMIVLKFFGLGHIFGSIFSLLFPFILIGLGCVGLKNGSRIIGGIMIFIGAIMLLGKLSGLIILAAAVGLIVWGVSMFKGQKRHF